MPKEKTLDEKLRDELRKRVGAPDWFDKHVEVVVLTLNDEDDDDEDK